MLPPLALLCLECARWGQVKYIKGSPNSGDDLAKARDASADAVFVMSSELGSHALTVHSDMAATLAVRSIKMSVPWVPVYCQVRCLPVAACGACWSAVKSLIPCSWL